MTAKRTAKASPVSGLLAGRTPALGSAVAFFVICFGLAAALRAWLEWVGPFPGDRWVLEREGTPWTLPLEVLDVTIFFSVIGSPVVAVATVLTALPFAARSAGVRGAAFVILATCGVVVNVGLKALSGTTPLMAEMAFSGPLNFPSGHTVYAVVAFGSLAVLARRAGRADIALPFAGLALLMGPARVIANAHFVSDVLAGYLVGAGWLTLAAALALTQSSPKRNS